MTEMMKLSMFLPALLALSSASLQDKSSNTSKVSILEPAPRDRTPSITSNTTMVTHRFRLSSRMSRQKRQASTLFDGSQNLKWVTWSGSLPDGAISNYNDYEHRIDYVCKFGCHAGFYNPSKGSYCHYPYFNKEYKGTRFEMLVNKDNFELLEWKDGSYGSVPEHSVKTCSHVDIYVAKNKYGLGKVHARHEAFFLPWKGSEYFYKSYQILTFGKEVNSEHISDIKYNTGVNVFQYPPETIFTTTVINNECNPVLKTPTITTTSQTQSTWDFSSSTSFGFRISFTVGIPLIVSGTTEISSERSFTSSRGGTKTTSLTHSTLLQVTVPPNHSCKVIMELKKYKADIPFTARLSRRYRNGKTTSTYISGIYHGVDNQEGIGLVERCRPVTNAVPCPVRSS